MSHPDSLFGELPALRTTPAPETQMDRIERKVDAIGETLQALLRAMADEDEDAPEPDLDGMHAGGERDQSQPL